MKNFFIIKSLSNNKGSAIMMVLLLAVGVSLLSVYLTKQRQIDQNISIRDFAQADIDTAIGKLNSLMQSPAHCNANFVGKSSTVPGSLTAILKCVGNINCRTSTTTSVYFPVNPATFQLFSDYTNGVPRARIVSANYTIETPMVHAGAQKPAALRLDVVFEKDLGKRNGTRVTSRTSTYSIYAFVVTGQFIANVYNPSATILGCALNSSSITPY